MINYGVESADLAHTNRPVPMGDGRRIRNLQIRNLQLRNLQIRNRQIHNLQILNSDNFVTIANVWASNIYP